MSNVLPKQSVILAGGRGTRLLEITKDIPKPMVPFHGKPFLEYLLVYLNQQGISEISDSAWLSVREGHRVLWRWFKMGCFDNL